VKPAGVLLFDFWDGVTVRQEICGGINGLLELNESLVVRLGTLRLVTSHLHIHLANRSFPSSVT
jgi:hypothetical protein